MTDVIVACITGLLALAGTALGTYGGIKTNQRVTDVKLDELTREGRDMGDFAHRLPVVEEKIKVINHRLENLEGGIQK